MGSRIKYLDLIKFFAIYFVILGHSIQYIGANPWQNIIWKFIYSFHVPLFMVVSGFFFSSSLKLSFGSFIKKKTIQLLLPSLCWYLILCLLNSALYSIINKELTLKYDLHGLLNSFWFLKSLFFCYIITYLSIKLFRNELAACIISCIAVCVIPFATYAAINFLLPFFWIGFYLKKYIAWIDGKGNLLWKISFVAFMLLFVFWNSKYTIYKSPIEILSYNPVSFSVGSFLIMLYRLFIGAVGSLLAIFSLRYLYHRFENNKITDKLCEMGKHTLGIYLIQTVIFEVFFFALSLSFDSLIVNLVSPFLSVLILLICSMLANMIMKGRYSKLLLLGMQG